MKVFPILTAAALVMAPQAFAQSQPPSTSVPAKPTLASAPAAAPPASAFDPRETFAPVAFPDPVNRYRSGDGTPGPDYWQNRADYDITARLDPVAKTLTGRETITYTNNSPSPLDSLWLQLDQNIYRADGRRAVLFGSRFKPGHTTEGYAIESVAVERDGQRLAAPSLVSGHPHEGDARPPARGPWRQVEARHRLSLCGAGPLRRPHRLGRHQKRADLRHRPSGIRAWRCSTMSAAGIRSPISPRNSTSNTATSTTPSRCRRASW